MELSKQQIIELIDQTATWANEQNTFLSIECANEILNAAGIDCILTKYDLEDE